MLIRIGGGNSGIKEYLEKGHKQGRENSRDELDERVILEGDLEFTNLLINDIESDGERFLHITLAFKEDAISNEVLRSIVQDFKKFAFSAYKDEEYNFYAEAHIPRIKSYENQKTGEFVERKPHIHIVIPKTNLLSGTHLNPFGMVEQNERYIDAFQEHVNNKYGLASPKDHRRVEFTNESDMIQRYKDDYFDGQSRDFKKSILESILENRIQKYSEFTAMISLIGDLKTRNAGKDNEYLNVKPEGSAKGINLKDYVFSRSFIELSDSDKRSILAAEVQKKYEIEGEARKDPANVQTGLTDWHVYRAKEIKYLNSGNQKLYQAYKAATSEGREQILEQQAKRFYTKHQERQHEPGPDLPRNPFEHKYRYKQPQRSVGSDQEPRRGAPGLERDPRGSIDAPRAYGGAGGGAGHGRGLDGADIDPVTRGRIAFVPNRQHDAIPIALFEATKTVDRMRTLSSLGMVRDAEQRHMLLPDYARYNLEHRSTAPDASLRRNRDSERSAGVTGRPDDSSISQVSRDFREQQAITAFEAKSEFDTIKRELDAHRLLADLSKSHGVVVEKYVVARAGDGSHRIKVGNRNLNVSDFLTKEMRLPWAESAAILRRSYRHQLARVPQQQLKQQPTRTLWREFQDFRRSQGGHRQLLTAQIASERSRSAMIRENLEKAKLTARCMSPDQAKASLSIAQMQYIAANAALRVAVKTERENFKAPVTVQYRTYLHRKAETGDEKALAELRRMSLETPAVHNSAVGYIHASRVREENNELIYRNKRVTFLVHSNGDVVYSLADKAVIRDHGDKLQMLQTDRVSIETGLRLAQEKFGPSVTLSGPKEFQERTARIAAEAGIKITFADPKLDKIMQLRASDLASERATKEAFSKLGATFNESRVKQPMDENKTKQQKGGIETPSKSLPDHDQGPER